MAELEAENQFNAFHCVKVYVPNALYKLAKMHADRAKLPVSRIVQIAIDNELDAPNPFYYPVEEPKNAYLADAYIEEAQLLARYLVKFASGCGKDQLMLCRRDVGILNKETFMCALRELREAKIIEEIRPPTYAKFKGYRQDYRYIRLKHVDRTALIARKRRLLEKQRAELEEIERIMDAENKAKQTGANNDS